MEPAAGDGQPDADLLLSDLLSLYADLRAVSDRFGRRPPLLVGKFVIYIIGSLMCAFAVNLSTLIAARIVQPRGAASASVLSLAISKDLSIPGKRGANHGYFAIIMAFAPMCAPVIGGWIIHYCSWRLVFCPAGGRWAQRPGWGSTGWRNPLHNFQVLSATTALTVYLRLFRNRRFAG
jgi:DHA1 family bicyclomycin/chloramphenicol resistance-like MFS transporter